MKLYTCNSGRVLQSWGDSFYAVEEPRDEFVIPFEVAEESIVSPDKPIPLLFASEAEFCEDYKYKFIIPNAEVSWL